MIGQELHKTDIVKDGSIGITLVLEQVDVYIVKSKGAMNLINKVKDDNDFLKILGKHY